MDRIIKSTHFSEKVAAFYFEQMCRALKFCHERKVVHRDLKPENFLLESNADKALLKLTDFGLSCHIESQDSIITDACGSAYYIAPEIFKSKYTKAVDVWALGVILYLFLSGGVPFGGAADSEAGVYQAIQKEALSFNGKMWAKLSPAAKELVAGLLEKDPSKRYTLDQALAHPWTTGSAAPDTALDRDLMTSMLSFQNNNKFKKKAMELVASTLSAADVSNLRAAFMQVDTDASGFLNFSELSAALKLAGIKDNKDTIMQAMKNMDTNGVGKISFSEFLTATLEKQLIQHQSNMWCVAGGGGWGSSAHGRTSKTRPCIHHRTTAPTSTPAGSPSRPTTQMGTATSRWMSSSRS